MRKGLIYTFGAISAALSATLVVGLVTPRANDDLAKLTDAALQKHPIFRAAKREYPEWYGNYLIEAMERLDRGADSREFADFWRQQFALLRATHAHYVVHARAAKLHAVAFASLELFRQLEPYGAGVCTDYPEIRAGKIPALAHVLVRPGVMEAEQEISARLLEAMADGRRQQVHHGKPTRDDYRKLFAHFSAQGWTTAELKLVADRKRALRVPRNTSCRMRRRFVEALLTFEPKAARAKFLVEFLDPLVPTLQAGAAPLVIPDRHADGGADWG